MINHKLLLLALMSATTLGACTATPHVLIGQDFIGEERTIKVLMTHPQGDDDDRVADQFMRVCTLKDGKETKCKDTLVLKDVRPGSLY